MGKCKHSPLPHWYLYVSNDIHCVLFILVSQCIPSTCICYVYLPPGSICNPRMCSVHYVLCVYVLRDSLQFIELVYCLLTLCYLL